MDNWWEDRRVVVYKFWKRAGWNYPGFLDSLPKDSIIVHLYSFCFCYCWYSFFLTDKGYEVLVNPGGCALPMDLINQ